MYVPTFAAQNVSTVCRVVWFQVLGRPGFIKLLEGKDDIALNIFDLLCIVYDKYI